MGDGETDDTKHEVIMEVLVGNGNESKEDTTMPSYTNQQILWVPKMEAPSTNVYSVKRLNYSQVAFLFIFFLSFLSLILKI